MFSSDEIRDLPPVISGPRFATYLRVTNNDVDHALALYQWNLEISAAFIVPLQVCEVAARNGVVEAIKKVHGPNWPWSNGFIRSLPVPKKAYHYNPQNNLRDVAARQPTTGKVVAELNFAFWERCSRSAKITAFGFPMETSMPHSRAFLTQHPFPRPVRPPSTHC
ncbi:protein of unknown function DUF1526 (plasmid) [Rhizorhabdus wittichii RW1]|uniref:Uncharacterized protein n=1 Tax=Rhizorhabdus wittichii (strain DSM 6014 / CCUG 31198 / JCM 15750 / NBRC 105917 / EY 4224 / RW1) TaxID=392499 RepID=A0A9J9LGS1_RHIWR|nr:protein of unknown function DUF1526 [Rhizorhabdus wittichii RW1]